MNDEFGNWIGFVRRKEKTCKFVKGKLDTAG